MLLSGMCILLAGILPKDTHPVHQLAFSIDRTLIHQTWSSQMWQKLLYCYIKNEVQTFCGSKCLIESPFVSQSVLTYSTTKMSMLSVWIASTTNSPSLQFSSSERRVVLSGWSRQVAVQLTILLVGILYSCAALEIDLGETGDNFGDIYDTYVPSATVQLPIAREGIYRKILPAQVVIAPSKPPRILSIDWPFVLILTPLALYGHSLKRRRLHVLHAIWQLWAVSSC